jgi:PTS system nitrogen regulatory IIA component
MDLSVREAARLLAVSEDAVYRWIREGSLPACRVRRQHRLNRVELQEWAAARGLDVSPELFAPDGSETPLSLADALEHGGIYRDIPGAEREQVLEALTELSGIPPNVDRRQLYQLLLARESLACTGVGRGIALPHPRDPVVLRLREPRVLLGFLRTPVDFGALDGEPVRALFLLLSPSVRAHLQILAQLAHALHDDLLRQLLTPETSRDAIIERLRALKRKEAGP